MKSAVLIGKNRILPPLSIQPNGYAWLLSWFDVHTNPASALDRIGRFQQTLDLSLVLSICWLAQRILGKEKPMILLGAWALILLQPFTGLWSRTIYSEQTVSFFSFIGFFATSYFLCRRQGKIRCLLGMALA